MLEQLFGLAGKRALVTGGSSGIGKAVAEAFCAAGASVAIASDRQADIDATIEEFRHKGYSVIGIQVRLKDKTIAEALVADAADGLGGPLDILVSNAGIEGPVGSTGDGDEGHYLSVFDVNLHSAYWLAAACRAGMKAQGGGSIILMASLSALRGNGKIGPYSMSKAALAALARNLAVEFGPDNIRANAIAPGMIRTPLSEPLLANPDFVAKRIDTMTPLRRVGQPEEIAAAALFLAGQGGAFTTGHTLVVDGGTVITDGS
jgi:NAD(P)-dependent dehydrogenase (short-subunit alcohol dehydrogenase family)